MVVCGIIALCNDSNGELRATCENTHLWWVLLAQVLLGAGLLGSANKDSGDDLVKVWVQTAFVLGVAGWGLAEAQSSCVKDKLSGSSVWLMVMIWSVAAFGILALALVGLCAVGACERTLAASPLPTKRVTAALDLETEETAVTALDGSPPRGDFKSVV